MRYAAADSKLRILQSAKSLFASHGFDRTTVRQICEDADVNIALVSYHFGGKEKVFQALFEGHTGGKRAVPAGDARRSGAMHQAAY